MTDDRDEIDEIMEIGRRIFAAIRGEGTEYSFDQIMTALMNMVVFQMSLVCPICRKDIARKIKRDLPRMVIYASQIAASNEDPPERNCLH